LPSLLLPVFIQKQDGQLQISRQLMTAQQLQWCLPLVHVWWQSVMDLPKMSLAQLAGLFKWVMKQEVGKLVKFMVPASPPANHQIKVHTAVNSPEFLVSSP
jgi:hypothetical protein